MSPVKGFPAIFADGPPKVFRRSTATTLPAPRFSRQERSPTMPAMATPTRSRTTGEIPDLSLDMATRGGGEGSGVARGHVPPLRGFQQAVFTPFVTLDADSPN